MAATAGIGFFAVDHFWNGFAPVVKYRMKRHIKFGKGVSDISENVSNIFTGTQERLVPNNKPVILLGPSGCGKTLLLNQIALDAKKNSVPVALINFRHIRPRQEVLQTNKNDILPIVEQVMSQIGYPVRETFVSKINNIIYNIGNNSMTFDKQEQLARRRLEQAINLLFDVCRSLKQETGMPPILLFDELYDLIKNQRLREKGGTDIFATVATNLIIKGVNSHDVRSVVAGSNSELARHLQDYHLGPVRTSLFQTRC